MAEVGRVLLFVGLVRFEVAAFDTHHVFVAVSKEPGEEEACRAAVDVAFRELATPARCAAVFPRQVGVVRSYVFQRRFYGVHDLPRSEWDFRAGRDGDDRSVPGTSWRGKVDRVGFPGRFHGVGDVEFLSSEGIEEVYLDVVGGVGGDASGTFSEEVQVFDGAFD